MHNFEYYNPVRVIFGKDTIAQLPTAIPEHCTKIMVTYGGGSIKRNGVYDQVVEALKDKQWVEFGGIEPNPLHETCIKAVERIREEHIDFLLAVGGGSVLDGTKYIAAAARFSGDDSWQILQQGGNNVTDALPIGAILTLPATGSEMNCFSVVSRESTQEKLAFGHPSVFPRFSILDPQVTYSLPDNQLRNGIVDTYVHVMEQYATYDVRTPLQDRQAEAIIKTLIEIAPDVMNKKNDYDSRADFMWCATQALNGIIRCGCVGDWTTHAIGHELTAFFGVAHGESLAIVMPALWAHQKHHKKAKLAQLAQRVYDVIAGDDDIKADAAIDKTREFFESIGMPTRLSAYQIDQAGIDKIVDRFRQRGNNMGEHQDITPEAVGEILNAAL